MTNNNHQNHSKQESPFEGMIFPLAVCLLLVVALFDMPYGYYRFLRIAVFVWGIWNIVSLFKQEMKGYLPEFSKLSLIGITILYNPILSISLNRETWSVLNILTIPIILLAHYNKEKKQITSKNK